MDQAIMGLIIANTSILAGSILSHSVIWYKLGRLEKTVYNNKIGGKR